MDTVLGRQDHGRMSVTSSLRRLPVGASLHRVPFTVGVFAVIGFLAVAFQTLWAPLAGRPLQDQVAYGLPALEAGRWWTILTGAVFALHPAQYIPILLGFLIFGGFTEWRLGTRRTAALVVACHLVGVGATVAFLQLTGEHGWDWATELSRLTDAGLSAGFLGAAAAASVTLTPPWRGRLRVALAGYVLVSVLYVGSISDVEHTFAVAFGLMVGPLLKGRRPRLQIRGLTRRDYRLLATGFLLLSGLVAVIAWFAPVSGPLASTLSPQMRAESIRATRGFPIGVIGQALIFFWLARSIYKGRRRAWRWALGITLLLTLVLVVSAIGLSIQHQPGWPVIVYQVLVNVGGLSVLIAGRRAFRNPSPRRARRTSGSLIAAADEKQQMAAATLLQEEGTVNRLAWMTTWPENRWFRSDRYAGYVAYRVHAGVALGLCDPVATQVEDRSALLEAFADKAHQDGLLPCLFSVTEEAAGHAIGRGWQALQVAEEAVIDLPALEFKGKAWQDVRTALNQATKAGMQYRLGPLAEQPRGIQVQVKAISAQWVEDKGLPEMGFTLGGVDEALDPHVRVGLAVDADSTVHGLTSWMPIYGDGGGEPVGWTLDVMRRLPAGFRYSMEFLISSACLAFKQEGCRYVSLSGAPLARAGAADSAMDCGPLDVFLDRLGDRLEPYYGFRSLHAFKAKFQPRFEPLFLVFPDAAALPRIGIALTRAYLPDAGLRDLVTLARATR